MSQSRTLGAIALALTLAGCALPSLSPDVYGRSDAGRIHNQRLGEVVMLRSVPISGRSGVIGTYGGGYIGAAVGGTVGDGGGENVAEAVGAVAGAVAGQKAEEVATRSQGLEITVKLDDGDTITLVQGADVPFEVGERVRVLISGNERGRIQKL